MLRNGRIRQVRADISPMGLFENGPPLASLSIYADAVPIVYKDNGVEIVKKVPPVYRTVGFTLLTKSPPFQFLGLDSEL